MKQYAIVLLPIVCCQLAWAQYDFSDYNKYIKQADSLYQKKEFKNAAVMFSRAFASIGWKGAQPDRYKAACAWANAGVKDSAFYQLDNIVTKANYNDYAAISSDTSLRTLHRDKRWAPLLKVVKQNKGKFNQPLAAQLDSIYTADQYYRKQMDSLQRQFGWESEEMQTLFNEMHESDSINLVKVEAILKQYGWVGADVVGARAADALFMVIQHSELATQEKYLPMMREAVKRGKASGPNLALLEDRVAIGRGKRQIYGSQIGRDGKTGAHFVLPLDDPDNVDKRRAAVGLPPLAEYLKVWNLKWDVEQYKKDLPRIEGRVKAGNK